MTKHKFTTETNLDAEATIDDDGCCIKVRIVTKVPRGYYYSCLNEVLETAETLFKFKN